MEKKKKSKKTGKKKASEKKLSKPHLEKDAAEMDRETCKACELSAPASCPFCTKEGLILIAIAIILVAVNHTWTRYLAWFALLAAFLVPLIRGALKRRS